MAQKRLLKELSDLRASDVRAYKHVEVDEKNLLHWKILLLPEKEPYNKGAFRISVDFPADYPFKPPKVSFITKIYHPNIDEKGQVCFDLISPDHWKPATRCEQVLVGLLSLIADPEPEHPLRQDVAEIFSKDRAKFNKLVEEHCKKNAEKRPE